MQTNQKADNQKLSATTHVQSLQEKSVEGSSLSPAIKYLEGHPRQYRFDAKEGVFTLNGHVNIGKSLRFQPIAWRIFTDNILNMGTKNWAEIFFIDEQNCVSAVLFHGYSVDNIFRLIEPLYYDDMTLADIIITVTVERKENLKIQPKGVYHIAKFSYEYADPATTQQVKRECSLNCVSRIYSKRCDLMRSSKIILN